LDKFCRHWLHRDVDYIEEGQEFTIKVFIGGKLLSESTRSTVQFAKEEASKSGLQTLNNSDLLKELMN